MLHIMGSFIVSSIRRRNLLRQLERMSYRDQLTQFGNRYAVDWFVEHEWNGEQIGVVYCDITGLKKVNDEQGHEAGDRLIIRACECLAGVFKGYGLYRIGGDEFLVLCLGIEEKDLREHVEKLRMDMKEHQVTMAVGMIWKEHGPKDIDLLLNESERLMYEDKDRYYKEHGLKRRR
ncbi:MAG: GGDEF domain-containing protein [Roseburia inulinivorans]